MQEKSVIGGGEGGKFCKLTLRNVGYYCNTLIMFLVLILINLLHVRGQTPRRDSAEKKKYIYIWEVGSRVIICAIL